MVKPERRMTDSLSELVVLGAKLVNRAAATILCLSICIQILVVFCTEH